MTFLQHMPALPFVLPAFTACLLLVLRGRLGLQRILSVASTLVLFGITLSLALFSARGGFTVYAMGDWPSHLGIVFVVDRLSALMLVLTAGVAVASLLQAVQGWDARGAHFHPLFHFQLMGLNGAFLTGDLFNLFVCFELMLIASYCLLQHGGGAARLRAGIHYVVLNLIGSCLFLIAVSLLYRVAGTLNMADLGMALAAAPPEHGPWIKAGALLLLVVFLLKGAAAPLYLWLPGAYGAASAPVAALFSVLTKVGAYAVLRVGLVVFGETAAAVTWQSLVPILAGVSLIVSALGAFSAATLTQLSAWLALGSSATLLLGIGLATEGTISGGLFYLLGSTLGIAAMFLLGDVLKNARGDAGDTLSRAPRMHGAGRIGALYLVVAVSVAGMPPLAGFLGKLLLLKGAGPVPWIWAVVLVTSLINLVALARAGTRLFWSTADEPGDGEPDAASAWRLSPVLLIVAAVIALTIAAGPVDRHVRAAAADARYPSAYAHGVLGERFVAVPKREVAP
ncbi:MAG: monovalent cation/H+ antiporter subunit D [Burkholderiales bacterium]|nr:monovalent cation/H+ antiporter subunit D [Burkholderiales bacterium]